MNDVWYAVSVWVQLSDTTYPVVFKSTDGRTWQHEPSIEYWGQIPTGLASDGKQLIASSADFAPGGGAVFTSSDGKTWTEHVADKGPASIEGVFADDNGIIAIGFRGGLVPITPVIWRSLDGASWSATTLADASSNTVPLSITRGHDGRYVLLAKSSFEQTAPCSEVPCPPDTLEAWYSDDGERWQRATFPKAELPRQSAFGMWVVRAASGFAAFATSTDGPMAWTSDDGTKWDSISLPSSLKSTSISSVASDGKTIVLFGSGGAGAEIIIGAAVTAN